MNNYKSITNIGDWGLGIGDWAQSPFPNPQSPFNLKIIINMTLIIKLIQILFK